MKRLTIQLACPLGCLPLALTAERTVALEIADLVESFPPDRRERTACATCRQLLHSQESAD